MNLLSQDRWEALLRSAGASHIPSACFGRLATAYDMPERHYHTTRHIVECLAEFDSARHLVPQPVAVELALWFHDVVYDPRAGDNEGRSARLARQCLGECGVEGRLADTVEGMILATIHQLPARGLHTAWVTDVDLSILGSDQSRFLEYERQIRREYSWVLPAVYCAKRGELIQRFLDRPRIYITDWFYGKYERLARRNLQMSLLMLSKDPPHDP